MADKDKLTTIAGAPVADNQNLMTAGPRGPALLQGLWFLEKSARFDREVISERRMHAKGSGAFGTFTVSHDISAYSKATLFSAAGKKTELFARFSTVAADRGAAEAERDIRGCAVKFYTEEGNWDLVGNNTPVFFLKDPLKFPDLNHAVKRYPRANMRSAKNNWDFWTMLPEALHQVAIKGYGSHTYSMVNAKGLRFWVNYHLKTQQGIKCLTDAEAIVAKDRECHQRDLYEAIERKDYPRWTTYLQTVPEKAAAKFSFNPFDLTKVWPHGDYPPHEAGVMELKRNPENYFADVEQAAFNPANIVPGLGFSYGDAQLYGLGVNHMSIPANAPRCPFHAFHRDGQTRMDGNYGATLGYEPNGYGEGLAKALGLSAADTARQLAMPLWLAPRALRRELRGSTDGRAAGKDRSWPRLSA